MKKTMKAVLAVLLIAALGLALFMPAFAEVKPITVPPGKEQEFWKLIGLIASFLVPVIGWVFIPTTWKWFF